MENTMVCNCKKVSYFDILDALHRCESFEALEKTAQQYPNNIAFDFMGRPTTYKKLVQEVEN